MQFTATGGRHWRGRLCGMRISTAGIAGCIAAILLAANGHAVAAEDQDFGIAPARELRLRDYAAPTPLHVPGGRTLHTAELRALLARAALPAERPLLFDVVGGEGHDSLPGAIWLPGAGRGQSFDDPVQARLAIALEALTDRDRTRPMVFFCSGVQCWLSYNASLRAVALGYTEVCWYRGGIEAWIDAGGAVEPTRRQWPQRR
jgi:PQQ-dependent catabolism-associated CXXCW motif protein